MSKKVKWLIVLLICSNVFFYFGYFKRGRVIEEYHYSVIALSKNYIANANYNMTFAIEDKDLSKRQAHLSRVQAFLQATKDSIRTCSVYYNYKPIDESYYIGNTVANTFFNNFSSVLNSWQMAIIDKDVKNIPTEDELNDFYADLEALTEAFQVYADVEYGDKSIETFNIEELNNIFVELAKNTKSESLYQMHVDRHFGRYILDD